MCLPSHVDLHIGDQPAMPRVGVARGRDSAGRCVARLTSLTGAPLSFSRCDPLSGRSSEQVLRRVLLTCRAVRFVALVSVLFICFFRHRTQ